MFCVLEARVRKEGPHAVLEEVVAQVLMGEREKGLQACCLVPIANPLSPLHPIMIVAYKEATHRTEIQSALERDVGLLTVTLLLVGIALLLRTAQHVATTLIFLENHVTGNFT